METSVLLFRIDICITSFQITQNSLFHGLHVNLHMDSKNYSETANILPCVSHLFFKFSIDLNVSY